MICDYRILLEYRKMGLYFIELELFRAGLVNQSKVIVYFTNELKFLRAPGTNQTFKQRQAVSIKRCNTAFVVVLLPIKVSTPSLGD